MPIGTCKFNGKAIAVPPANFGIFRLIIYRIIRNLDFFTVVGLNDPAAISVGAYASTLFLWGNVIHKIILSISVP